jgi:D-arabinose 1-dehydrogenase-like Zn-dependent alcohol dehydrogenase
MTTSDSRVVQQGVFLAGDSTAVLRNYVMHSPGPKQILLEVGASGICGSDIGYIYNGYKTHKGLGNRPAYLGVISGHEPSGTIVEVGSEVVHLPHLPMACATVEDQLTKLYF